MGKLSGKIAFITGGSQGIGEATALLFAEEGASVAVVASTNMAKAQTVVDKIKFKGGSAIGLVADVTKQADVKRALQATESALGPVDIVDLLGRCVRTNASR
jgi:NAD(P)-dependent dehydrogenase (short-subunit alcohol dehydrogenase family)